MAKTSLKTISVPNPLRKSISTGEGILIYATNVILYIATLAGGLPWAKTALFVTILNAVHAFQRSFLKAVAALKLFGISPTPPPDVPPVPGPTEEKALLPPTSIPTQSPTQSS